MQNRIARRFGNGTEIVRPTTMNQTQLNSLISPSTLPFNVALSITGIIICSISAVALCRTKRTPYMTKLLTTELLVFRILYLIFFTILQLLSGDSLPVIAQLCRGFLVSSCIIVGCMAVERVLVLSRPYAYIKWATKSRIGRLCAVIGVIVSLQCVLAPVIYYYDRKEHNTSGSGNVTVQYYYFAVFGVIYGISCAAYIKIFIIIQQVKHRQPHTFGGSDYKSTVVSWAYFVSSAMAAGLFLSRYVTWSNRSTVSGARLRPTFEYTSIGSIVLCMVDALIYDIYFKETRLELLKMTSFMCNSWSSDKINRLRMAIFEIPVYQDGVKDNDAVPHVQNKIVDDGV